MTAELEAIDGVGEVQRAAQRAHADGRRARAADRGGDRRRSTRRSPRQAVEGDLDEMFRPRRRRARASSPRRTSRTLRRVRARRHASTFRRRAACSRCRSSASSASTPISRARCSSTATARSPTLAATTRWISSASTSDPGAGATQVKDAHPGQVRGQPPHLRARRTPRCAATSCGLTGPVVRDDLGADRRSRSWSRCSASSTR